jgi:hypothetical protein
MWGGVSVLTVHQSCDKGKGKDLDGHHGHIICPGRDSHLPADHSCEKRVSENAHLYYYYVTGEDE